MYERVNHRRGDRRGKTSGPLAWRSGDEAGGHNFKPLDLLDDDDDDDDDGDDGGSEEADRVVRGRLSGIPLFHLRERECAIRVGTLAPCQERLFYTGQDWGIRYAAALTEYATCALIKRERERERVFQTLGQEGKLDLQFVAVLPCNARA